MRKIILPLLAVTVALLATGCANQEQKLGRGISNTYEIVRMGEMRRSIEQTSVLESPGEGYTVGAIAGFDRTVARTGIGIYEVLTFPFPPYHPVATRYLTPQPVYPDSYKPGLPDSPLFSTDTYSGFSGGDAAPFIPGSRFSVINN